MPADVIDDLQLDTTTRMPHLCTPHPVRHQEQQTTRRALHELPVLHLPDAHLPPPADQEPSVEHCLYILNQPAQPSVRILPTHTIARRLCQPPYPFYHLTKQVNQFHRSPPVPTIEQFLNLLQMPSVRPLKGDQSIDNGERDLPRQIVLYPNDQLRQLDHHPCSNTVPSCFGHSSPPPLPFHVDVRLGVLRIHLDALAGSAS
jgi:hypothetical protein